MKAIVQVRPRQPLPEWPRTVSKHPRWVSLNGDGTVGLGRAGGILLDTKPRKAFIEQMRAEYPPSQWEMRILARKGKRWEKHGKLSSRVPDPPRPIRRSSRQRQLRGMDPGKRFWSRVKRGQGDACDIWDGPPNKYGYGQVHYKGKTWRVHRLAWVLNHGIIPRGQVVRHRCPVKPSNRLCVKHLTLGTHEDNNEDARQDGTVGRPKKLSPQQASDLREAHSQGAKLKDLAIAYGVHYDTAREIVGVRKRRGSL